MKNSLLTISLLICISFFANAASSSKRFLKFDSLSCLKIEGRINNADETDDACIVELIGLNDQIDTITLKEGKVKFKFVLNKDSYYAIRVSKKGYLSKLVCVNTEILTEIDGIYTFEFETTLLKEAVVKTLNKDILDFPVAIIHFDYQSDSFSYNKEYSAYIKRELHTAESKPVKKAKSELLAPLQTKSLASADSRVY